MSRVIAIANQKGGVGKTTSAFNLGHALAENDQRVLLVDFDGQCSLTVALQLDVSQTPPHLSDLLLGRQNGVEIADAIQHTSMPRVDILPSTPDLAEAEVVLVSAFKREETLSNLLRSVGAQYDYILIDCPPNLGLLTTNALVAADSVLVPIESDYLALRGAQLISRAISQVAAQYHGRPDVLGVLITKHDKRTKHAEEMMTEIRAAFGARVFDSVIPLAVSARDAIASGLSVLAYRTKSPLAMAYRDVAREIITKYGQAA